MDMDRHLFRRVCRHVTMYAQEDTDVQLLSSITFMGLCFEMCLDICVDVCENKCSEMNKHAHHPWLYVAQLWPWPLSHPGVSVHPSADRCA